MLVLFQIALFAQSRTIKGTVKDSKTNETLPGVTVLVEGTTNATTTDIKGEYTINVEGEGKKLMISSVGYLTQVVPADKDVIDIAFAPNTTMLNETVVTALGISREKKTLGYATQEISGDQLSDVKSGNFLNQISGKVAGVQIKNSGNLGGSTNILIRGTTSILGNNQALFIVDGVPIDNSTANSTLQSRAGYDYGNPVSDINPDEIESMNVLKGAAATALYGARAANGVVLITTKKGKLAAEGKKRFGVTLNSNVTMGVIDKSTFPKYQNKYGAGYGPYYDGPGSHWFLEDVKGDGTADDLVVPYTEDASMGAAFDPNLMVYQWDAFVPGSKNYHKATPWVAAGKEGPISFFNKAYGATNGVTLDGASDKGTFRVSYSNSNQTGIMPNSSLKKNTVGFNGGFDLTDKLSVGVSGNYISNTAVGRNETGYNQNIMANYRQWWETNVKVVDLKEAYDNTKLNYGWNPAISSDPTVPIFWDNPYFQRYESYENDKRNRFYGNVTLNYKINSMLSVMGRASIDQYSYLQEERIAVGSVPKPAFGIGGATVGSGYSRLNKNFRENNYDLMVNFHKELNEKFSLTALLGTNIRRSNMNSIYASTNGGLVVPKLYSISNSKETPNASIERDENIGVNGFFGSASLGYKRFLFVDVTARQDYSSTLPAAKNHFFYPGVSASFVFSEKLKQFTWLDFGKLRANYAKVGNDAPYASIKDTYAKPIAFGGTTLFSLPNTKNNQNLKPEISTTMETGLEMIFFKRRLGFDVSLYNKKTVDQIVPVAISTATGFSSKFVNAGTVVNKGIEIILYGTPVQGKNFSWKVQANFARNRNKVVELYEGVKNLQIATFQGGITMNATLGESYGALQGTDYVYLNGQKVIGADGYYKKTSTTNNIIGNVNPDFNAGITNTFIYKAWALSFLIDMQKGGDVYSLDMYYGLATGLYEETAGTNDLGNPVRNTLANGGGVVLDGVTANGQKNTKRVAGDDYRLNGYAKNPDKAFIYDASYVKLREITISYKIPFKKESFFSNATVGLVGSNLWIIFKNLPNADPEAGLSSGNVQGYQTGVMPTTRNYGFNLKLQF